MATQVKCYAAMAGKAPLEPFEITRRAVSETDVSIDIKFAGICHSDIHQAREEWGPAKFPMVPGHEIGGVVTEVGSGVTKFKVGDIVGVGCMVDSCRSCKNCSRGEEQFCQTSAVFTYNSSAKYPHCPEYNADGGAPTYGGYSQKIVVDQLFVLKIPSNLDLAAATPLLCAGITTYSPMKQFGLKPEMRFGVLGLGGLGHMAVKFGKAFGCHTTVVSRGMGKKDGAIAMGADAFVDSTNEEEFKAAMGSMDFIINTIAADHDVGSYMGLLGVDGKMIMVGVAPSPFTVHAAMFVMPRKTLAGSLIGGIPETQEMLDFCGAHNITCDIELISADKINEAYERTLRSDVKYRFVIDTATL